MNIGDRDIEAAERSVALERDRGLALARASLAAIGSDDCVACGEPIEAARKAALPSAVRCVRCQQARERGRRDI